MELYLRCVYAIWNSLRRTEQYSYPETQGGYVSAVCMPLSKKLGCCGFYKDET